MRKTFIFTIALMFVSINLFPQQLTIDWATTAGGGMPDFGEGVTVDDAGNAYITGNFRDEMTLLGETFDPESDKNTMFLAKVDPEMDLQWSVTGEADGMTGSMGFKTAYHDGHVYLYGDFRGEATFSSTDFTETTMNAETRAMFVAKYTDDGVLDWIKKMESSHVAGLIPIGSANNLAVDEDGAVYVTTNFRDDIEIDGTLVDPEGSGGSNYHGILVKFDALGAYQWHWNTTHEGDDRGEAVTVTPDGHVLFAIRYNEEITVNDVNYANEGGGIAIIELEADGTYVWDHQLYTDDTNDANLWDMRFCANNNLYVVGESNTTLTWDDDNIWEPVNTSKSSAFVLQIDDDTNISWAEFFGDDDENTSAKTVRIGDEGVYVAGEHIGTMVLNDDITVTSNDGSTDIFYALIDPVDGTFKDAGAFGGTGNEYFGDMDLSPEGEAYFMGRYLGTFEAAGESFPSEGSFDFFVTRYTTVDELLPPADPLDITNLMNKTGEDLPDEIGSGGNARGA
ncbi:MAG: hypothetical protein ACQESL_03985, partial [Bacteroidota bacterium]